MATSDQVTRARADAHAIADEVVAMVADSGMGQTNRTDDIVETCVWVWDTTAQTAAAIAERLRTHGLASAYATSTEITFGRRRAGARLTVKLLIDDTDALVRTASDAALALRHLIETGHVDAARRRFGDKPVAHYQAGRRGKAYASVATAALAADRKATFGDLDRFADRPHTVTLATLLTDAVNAGDGTSDRPFASVPMHACSVLAARPDLVDVAAALDLDLPENTP